MTAEGWSIIIGAVFLGIAQIVTIVLNWIGQHRNLVQGRVNAANIAEVHRTINSGLTRQLEDVRIAGEAAGREQVRVAQIPPSERNNP